MNEPLPTQALVPEDGLQRVDAGELERFATRTFTAMGLSPEAATICAVALVQS